MFSTNPCLLEEMEEPTNVTRITASVLLLRVNQFTISKSYYFLITTTFHNTDFCNQQEKHQETSLSITGEEESSPCLPLDNDVLSENYSNSGWDNSSNLLQERNQEEKVSTASHQKNLVPFPHSVEFSTDNYCTLILLLLVVLRQAAQKKNLQNNSSEDLNFNCNCT